MSTYTELLTDAIDAAGGNADNLPDTLPSTLLKALGAAVGNTENQLINCNFQINQRGKTEYTDVGYTVDGWHKPYTNTTVQIVDSGIKIITNTDHSANVCALRQIFAEDVNKWRGKTITFAADITETHDYAAMAIVCATSSNNFSAKVNLKTGINTATLTLPDEDITLLDARFVVNAGSTVGDTFGVGAAQLVIGSFPTQFAPPNPTIELLKCQRYYQVHTTGDIDPVDLRPSMATIKDIKERSDGKYEYIAEL